MLKFTTGSSSSLVVAIAFLVACSSTPTDDQGATGGSGGSATPNAGSGGSGNGGTPSTGGGGKCTDETITCIDATRASGCNFTTGVVDTFSCVEELAASGLTSSGCTKSPAGDECAIDGLSDQACADGAAAFAYCSQATTREQANFYLRCFFKDGDAGVVFPCFAKYVGPTKTTIDDCFKAADVCLQGADPGGPGGAGQGGAGSDAGAGGAR